jgi:predicted O-methyltransferase YrrM
MKQNVNLLIQEALRGKQDTSQHGITLFALVCSLSAKKVLELGVRTGGSTIPFLLGLHGTNGHLTSVDINDHALHLSSYGELDDQLKPHWTFIKSDALHFLKESYQEEKYDLIYIDDWHSSEHVYKELNYIKHMLKDSTLIVLHDLMHSYKHPRYNTDYYPLEHEFGGTGPYGGVKKFILENPNFEMATIPVNHGLTILRKVI